jgi:hypothetical protein
MKELVELEEEVLKYKGNHLPDQLLASQERWLCRQVPGKNTWDIRR